MSIRVMSKVWEHSRQSGSHLLMILAIADFSDDDGRAYPSVPTLAKKCRMQPRNANVILAALRKSGELEIRVGDGPHGTNLYRVLPLQALAPLQSIAPLQALTSPPAKACSLPLQPVAPKPSVNHQEPSSSLSPRKSRKPEAVPVKKIVALYHEHFPSGHGVTKLSKKRMDSIAARYREIRQGDYRPVDQSAEKRDETQALLFFVNYFQFCESLDWCCSREPMGGKLWRASIDNLMGAEFMAKRSDEAHDARGSS